MRKRYSIFEGYIMFSDRFYRWLWTRCLDAFNATNFTAFCLYLPPTDRVSSFERWVEQYFQGLWETVDNRALKMAYFVLLVVPALTVALRLHSVLEDLIYLLRYDDYSCFYPPLHQPRGTITMSPIFSIMPIGRLGHAKSPNYLSLSLSARTSF